MASSIKIHQDLFGFQKTYKGFTRRQITCAAIAVGIVALGVWFFSYGLELPMEWGAYFGLLLATIPLAAGFLPLSGMPAEEYIARMYETNRRGQTIVWEGEHVAPMEGVTNRDYKKRARREKGFECAYR